MLTARDLLALTPEEREPFLEVAATNALPLYEADRQKPAAERELTANLETGDFHQYASEGPSAGSEMDFTPCEIDILFDAVEGYTPLFDAKWECSRRQKEKPEAEWIMHAQTAILNLLAQELISLFWDESDGIPREVAPLQVSELLRQDAFWSPADCEGGTPLCFAATPKGEEVIRTNEQIKAYYQSGEFASRYPDPQWHPMKRSNNALQDRGHSA